MSSFPDPAADATRLLAEHPFPGLLARPSGDADGGRPTFRDHIRAVATAMVDTPHDGGPRPELRRYIGAFHDFAKCTAYFQEYIRDVRGRSQWTHHSALGALAAFYALRDADAEVSNVEQVMAWYVIHRHHGTMIDLTDCYSRAFDRDQLPIYHEQARALQSYADAIEAAYASLGIPFDVTGFVEWVESNDAYRDVRGALDYHGSVVPDRLPTDSAYDVIDCYGRLISVDRLDASGFAPPDRRELPTSMVEQYVAGEFDRPEPGSINALREAARRTAEQQVRETIAQADTVDDLPRQFSISLPTGLGKTLTGIHAALLLRGERAGADQETPAPRIIYVLPYTSIIDQVDDVIRDVYESVTGRVPDPATLLKQHYLSSGYHQEDREYEYSQRERSMFSDRWDSEIVVTTYVQLIEGLLTPTPGQALRWQNLSPSIIVLDEPQSIPSPYWHLVDDTLTWLAEQWDLTTISMTATHPRISGDDDDDDQPRPFVGGEPLIPHPAQFHDRLNRVQYRVDDTASRSRATVPPTSWSQRAIDHAREHPEDDVLMVVNTLRVAETVHDHVAQAVASGEINGAVRYLSSNVRPIDRRERIADLTSDGGGDTDQERQLIVSTQVVETGVDLSADHLLRDFAPLDTIVQAAGRCNRHSTHGESSVDIVRMGPLSPTQQPPCEQVYDDPKLDMTRRVLSGADHVIPEPTMVDECMPAYFDELAEHGVLDRGRDQLQAWGFDRGRVTLIPDDDERQLFISLDAGDDDLIRQFAAALDEGDREQIERLKARVYERVVSARENQIDTDALDRAAADETNRDVALVSEDRNLYALSGAFAAAWYTDPVGLRVS